MERFVTCLQPLRNDHLLFRGGGGVLHVPGRDPSPLRKP